MATRRQIEEATTISSGGTSTSDPVVLDNEETTSIQFQGDANGTNLNFLLEAKVDAGDEWSEFDALQNVDLTVRSNNNLIEQWDTLDLENLRIKTTNQNSAATDIDIIVSFSDQQ